MEIVSLSVGMMPTNCYLVASEQKNAVAIDPGAQPERIRAALEERGWALRMILLTHGHFDHVGAVKALQGPEVPVGVPRGDEVFLSDPERVYAGLGLPVTENLRIRPDFTYAGGQSLRLDELSFEVLFTPGHTPGSVCLLCGGAVFSGDTLFRNGCGRTDLYGGSWQELCASLKTLASLPGDRRVLPGHGAETSLAYERKYNQLMGAGYDFDA